MDNLSYTTPVHLTVKTLCALLGAVVGVTVTLYSTRDLMLKDVQNTVKVAISEEADKRNEQAKHFVTREEWLAQNSSFQIRFEQRMGELRMLILQGREKR